MNNYLIIPSCSDLNRGDQALVWETVKIAKKSGFIGNYYMLRSGIEPTNQSEKEGIGIISSILLHPGRVFKSNNNVQYTKILVLKWGTVAFFDFFKSILLLNKITRRASKFILNKVQNESLETFKYANAIFVKGGGFLHSSGKITDSYKIYYLLFHIMLAQSMNKPVYIMPNSYGPFKGIFVAGIVRRVLKRCNLVTTRESISSRMLNEIGVESKIIPDLGFGLKKSTNSNNEIERLHLLYPNRKLVGITVRPYRFPNSKKPLEDYEFYKMNLTRLAKWLFESNYMPVFIEHALAESAHEDDKCCIKEIVSNLGTNEYCLIACPEYTCRDLKLIYSGLDYMIGTRFHSVIFALSEGIPSIAITYGGNKGNGIMHDLNLADYAIPINEFEFERAKKTFLTLCRNKSKVCEEMITAKINIDKKYNELERLLKGAKHDFYS